MSFRYYFPNLDSSNSYDIREFKYFDEVAQNRIKKDIEMLALFRSQIVGPNKKYFVRKNTSTQKVELSYLAEFPNSPDDEEQENPFVLVKNSNNKLLQYRKDAFDLLNFYPAKLLKTFNNKKLPTIPTPLPAAERFATLSKSVRTKKINSHRYTLSAICNQMETALQDLWDWLKSLNCCFSSARLFNNTNSNFNFNKEGLAPLRKYQN